MTACRAPSRDQHGRRRSLKDGSRRAPEEHLLDDPVAARSDDHQVGVPARRLVHDDRRRATLPDAAADRETGRLQRITRHRRDGGCVLASRRPLPRRTPRKSIDALSAANPEPPGGLQVHRMDDPDLRRSEQTGLADERHRGHRLVRPVGSDEDPARLTATSDEHRAVRTIDHLRRHRADQDPLDERRDRGPRG